MTSYFCKRKKAFKPYLNEHHFLGADLGIFAWGARKGEGAPAYSRCSSQCLPSSYLKLERVAAPKVESHEVVERNVEDVSNGFNGDSYSGIPHRQTGLSCEVINVELYNRFIIFNQ